jgi:hypothetical protein
MFSTIFLTGCLYSVHHFHTGNLLPAGKSQTTLGLGREPLWRCENASTDTSLTKKACNEDGTNREKIVRSEVFQGSLDYRLGIKDSFGPFPGFEIQWHLEAPTNPATMEFALNLALPASPSYHHKIGGGWGIGAWANNSLFMEYAISRQLGIPRFFGNIRVTYLATQIDEVLRDDFSKALPQDQILVLQSGMGAFFQLPKMIILPDFLIPQINLTLPQVPFGDQKFRRQDIPLMQWNMNFGLGWTFQ